MRVTLAIREYVTDEIRKKYDVKKAEISADYDADRNRITNHLREILDRANAEAAAYLKECGYANSRYSNADAPCFETYGSIYHPVIGAEINKKCSELSLSCDRKIKQVLFDLEMGETAKAELKEVLDNLVIE